MPETYYRTGQAAAALGISSYAIHRLCAAGLVEAEFTGKQWRSVQKSDLIESTRR